MARDKKLRTVIMHDPELDDQNTIIRYLLYCNDFDTEGLIYSSSRFHWKGDGKGTLFHGESEHSGFGIGAIDHWRWDEGSDIFEKAIDAYEKVYRNLVIHAEGYPHPDELRSKIMNGNIEFPGDMSKDSPGSELIEKLILDEKPGKLYLLTGAGQSTIGRSLKAIAEKYENTDEWTDIYEKIGKKVVIQSFGDQDGVYESYIGPNWPNIEFREMATKIWGYFARKVVQPEDCHYLCAAWTNENVSSVGPLGELYMVWGDGKQIHKNDIADFFGFSGVTAEQLKELGYIPWYGDPEEKGAWISEGDTSMYMNLLDNGLDGHIEAGYGGWGGRNGKDVDPKGYATKDYASTRWFGAAQRDFAARLKWTVTSDYKKANHHPIINIVGLEATKVKPGQIITLLAQAEDPDGNQLVGKWWQYVEAGTYPGEVQIDSEKKASAKTPKISYPFILPPPNSPVIEDVICDEIEVRCKFKVPLDAANGQTLHFIIEVTDYANLALTSYKRIVLTVER